MGVVENIDYVSKIDFTKGFARFHAVWKITDIENNSTNFKTVVQNGENTMTLRWRMRLAEDQVSTNSQNPLKISLQPNNSSKTVAIVRLAAFIADKDPVFDNSKLIVFSSRLSRHRLEVPDGVNQDENVVVHCWIDIPLAITEVDDEEESSEENCHFHDDFAAMFQGVLGEESDFGSVSDVTVAVVDKESKEPIRRFLCHRNVLMARSPVFRRMCGNDLWKEGSSNRVVEIEDIDEKTMEQVLRYIYTDLFPKKASDLSNIIFAADKYDLAELKSWCFRKLMLCCHSDADRIEQLLLADRHQLDQMKAVSFACLSTHPAQFRDKPWRDQLSEELQAEFFVEFEKRQVDTKGIRLSREVVRLS